MSKKYTNNNKNYQVHIPFILTLTILPGWRESLSSTLKNLISWCSCTLLSESCNVVPPDWNGKLNWNNLIWNWHLLKSYCILIIGFRNIGNEKTLVLQQRPPNLWAKTAITSKVHKHVKAWHTWLAGKMPVQLSVQGVPSVLTVVMHPQEMKFQNHVYTFPLPNSLFTHTKTLGYYVNQKIQT